MGTGRFDANISSSTAALNEVAAEWRPRVERSEGIVTAAPVEEAAAVLGRRGLSWRPGEPLPLLWHWFFGNVHLPAGRLADDGLPNDCDFVPPLPARRRMYAGGRIRVERPLLLGESFTRESRLKDVVVKQGGTGAMMFVTVERAFMVADERRIVEEQDYVYRPLVQDSGRVTGAGNQRSSNPMTRPPADNSVSITADSVSLFRISALTANTNRLHYDLGYATDVLGHPGLVVHGPLLALLMAEVLSRQERTVSSFSWRASRPLFAPCEVSGWIESDGDVVRLAGGSLGGAVAVGAIAEAG